MDEHFFSAGNTYSRPTKPVTEELLAEFKRVRRLSLPSAYVELLRIQNGGCVRKQSFVKEEFETFKIEELAGIGEGRCGGRDLLIAKEIEDKDGNDVTNTMLVFADQSHAHLALDYRACGPDGSPSVVDVDVLESPMYIGQIADDFQTFVDGLRRDESQYFLGLLDCEVDAALLVRRLEKCLAIKAEASSDVEMPSYTFQHEKWRLREEAVLLPNVDYATEYDGKKLWSRPAGLYFPECPECTWMLRCILSYQRMVKLIKRLQRHDFNLVVLHEPEVNDIVVTINGRPAPKEEPKPVVVNIDWCMVELPANFGQYAQIRQINAETGETTDTFSGDYVRVVISNRGLFEINKKDFGSVNQGDRIRVIDKNTAYVNDDLRKPSDLI